ncbi:DMT family transporter [Oscillatoria sp. FACHB-1407]|uniref:DMT family transporter n=1 Tax=Oscillatoria sp. FACHB-1407 TaxID=2692847 RepID=UPI0018EFBABE|nr:DMT family transporter [Oscillatoria sp. FACHB-1407]
MTKHSVIFDRIPSVVYLWTAILIFAASNAVTRKVTEIGAQHLIDGRNPISLCNVLFVGNLCALVVMISVFGRQWNKRTLRQLSYQDWLSLVAIAMLSGALAPALIFAALDTTNVTNVVLIGRLEPPLTLIFSVLLLKARVNVWTALGSLVSLVGVTVTAVIASSEHVMMPLMGGLFHVGRGELMTAIAACVLAIATVISKSRLKHIPLGIFNIVRVGLGTVVFFVLANVLYGAQHFVDVFSPFLWKWMLLYGSVIVVAGQLCWFAGLRHSTPAMTTLASSFNPIAAIAMAYLILGEIPTAAQYTGATIILAGVVLSLIGSLQEIKSRKHADPTPYGQQMGMITGFRGV